MSLFGRKEKEEIARLKEQLTPEQIEIADVSGKLKQVKSQLEKAQNELRRVQKDLAEAKSKIIETDEAALMQSFGFYTPHYSYTISEQYQAALKDIREKQKSLIKSGEAVLGETNWQVNGSASKGKKMVSDMQKLLLRAYNAECDDAIEHVKFNNIESCEKKIFASAEAISKLGVIMSISITQKYINLKMNELYLMYEYQLKKQEEKEEQKRLREEMREQAKLQKELENARKEIEKEQKHYKNALEHLEAQLATANEAKKEVLLEKKSEIIQQLADLDKATKDVDYRAANQKAGYVYIISNIGAFGEDVYKIGMTRRLDPMERVDELGDASVPFDFDIHAMIFTDDAPKLEAALHKAFEDRRVNMINARREFFRVSLDEIKKIVQQNYDKTVEFVDIPNAEQYRQTLMIQQNNVKAAALAK